MSKLKLRGKIARTVITLVILGELIAIGRMCPKVLIVIGAFVWLGWAICTGTDYS